MKTEYLYVAVFLLMSTAIFIILGLGNAVLDEMKSFAERKTKSRGFKKPAKLAKAISKLALKAESLITGSEIPIGIYAAFTVIGAAGGFTAGKVIYSSYVIAAAVSVMGMITPLLVLAFRQTKTGTVRLERLCSSMMILSNSYISTEDFIQSVQENVANLDYSAPFKDFLTYVLYMDSDIKRGLRRMEEQVCNPYFSQWIDALVLAQDDRSLKHVCASVVDSMHDVISAQQESDAAMYAVWRDYILTLVLIFSVPLVFKYLMADAYVTMTTSPVGQVLFLLLLAAVIYSVIRAVKINAPIMR